MNPIFSYSGGKRRLLKYILPVIPAHETYIEPFAGGLAVFLAKERCKVEVINDLNHEVGNFYLYVREHYESLCREIFADFAHVEIPFRYCAGTGNRIRPEKSENKPKARLDAPQGAPEGREQTSQMLVSCDALADALRVNFNKVSKVRRAA